VYLAENPRVIITTQARLRRVLASSMKYLERFKEPPERAVTTNHYNNFF